MPKILHTAIGRKYCQRLDSISHFCLVGAAHARFAAAGIGTSSKTGTVVVMCAAVARMESTVAASTS